MQGLILSLIGMQEGFDGDSVLNFCCWCIYGPKQQFDNKLMLEFREVKDAM